MLIPHKTTASSLAAVKLASACKLALEDEPAAYQLVGRVTAYQGEDG